MIQFWAVIVANQVGRAPACGCDHLMLKSPPVSAHQPGGLLIVAITPYWQHVVADDLACPVVTW
jgi:hypothetical protein